MLACASSGEGLSGDDVRYLLLRVRLIPSNTKGSETCKLINHFNSTSTAYSVRPQKSAYAQTVHKTPSYPSIISAGRFLRLSQEQAPAWSSPSQKRRLNQHSTLKQICVTDSHRRPPMACGSLLLEKAITIIHPYTHKFAIIIPSATYSFLSLNLVNVLWRKNAKADLFFIPLQHHLRLFLTTSFWMTDTAPEMWYPDCVCHIVLSSPCCREPNQSSTWIARIKIKTGPTVSWRSWFLVV